MRPYIAIICLILCGCKKNDYPGWSVLELTAPEGLLMQEMRLPAPLLRPMRHVSDSKITTTSAFLDCCVDGNIVYVLQSTNLMSFSPDHGKVSQTAIPHNTFERIVSTPSTVVMYGKNLAIVINKSGKQEMKFNYLIADVLECGRSIIFMMSNGSCVAYSTSSMQKLWELDPQDLYGIGIVNAAKYQDKLVFVNQNSQVVFVDADNGMLLDSIPLKESDNLSSSIAALEDGFVATADDTILRFRATKDGPLYKRCRVKGLRQVVSFEGVIVLCTKEDYIFTDSKHVENGLYFSKVPISRSDGIFVKNNSAYIFGPTWLKIYNIYNGHLVQEIKTKRSAKFILYKDRLLAISRKCIQVYK